MSRKREKTTRERTEPRPESPIGNAQRAGHWRDNPWVGSLLLMLLTLAAYQQAWHAGFIWDDDGHVTRADLRSLHGLARIWFEPGATQQYYPLLHSFFWLEFQAWGAAPLGYHVVNVLLHGLVSLLLFRVFRAVALPGAFLAAALFAVHPVAVESVAWISEQKNTLSAVFYLAAALAYLGFDRERRPGAYLGAMAFFVLALASKSVTATLPAALLVFFWWRRGRLSWRSDAMPLLPWFGLAAGAGAMTVWMERTQVGASGAAFSLGMADRFLIAGRAVWFYAGKLFWPANLTFIYPRWELDSGAAGQYVFPVAALVVGVALFALRRRMRGPLATALLFAGTLFPALGFFNIYPFIYSFVADHFQYLAAAMMIGGVTAGGALAARRLPPSARQAAQIGAAGLVVLFAALTWRQGGRYADATTLWRETLARNPRCWMACDNLGNDWLNRGRWDEAEALFQRALAIKPGDDFAQNNTGLIELHRGQIDGAIGRFATALKSNPENAEAHNNLGLALQQKGLAAEAMLHFARAIALKDQYPAARFNLGNSLLRAGKPAEAAGEFQKALASEPGSVEIEDRLAVALFRSGRQDEAVAHWQTAIALKDNFAAAHFDLANALLQQGRTVEAIAGYRRGLQAEATNVRARVSLAHALLQAGRNEEAEAEFQHALEIEPGDAEANNDLGVVLLQKGGRQDAVAHFQKAVETDDAYAEAHVNLANVFLQDGSMREAARQYEKALRADPANARAQNNLGLALLQSGRGEEAIGHFRKALELEPDYAQARRNLEIALAQQR